MLVTTIGFLAGNPFGIDNAYVAIATPIVIMTICHVLKRADSDTKSQASRSPGNQVTVAGAGANPETV